MRQEAQYTNAETYRQYRRLRTLLSEHGDQAEAYNRIPLLDRNGFPISREQILRHALADTAGAQSLLEADPMFEELDLMQRTRHDADVLDEFS